MRCFSYSFLSTIQISAACRETREGARYWDAIVYSPPCLGPPSPPRHSSEPGDTLRKDLFVPSSPYRWFICIKGLGVIHLYQRTLCPLPQREGASGEGVISVFFLKCKPFSGRSLWQSGWTWAVFGESAYENVAFQQCHTGSIVFISQPFALSICILKTVFSY